MKKDKGQSLVEFTLVLPFFLLLVFAIIYGGMLFHDYSTVSNVARSIARERAITPDSTTDDSIIGYYYNGKSFTPTQLVTGLYKPIAVKINDPAPKDANDIMVTITMELGDSSYVMRMVCPQQYVVVYHMRKEVN